MSRTVRRKWLLQHLLDSAGLQQYVQGKLGEEVTLQCQISQDETISVLKWSRPDLNTDGYLYFYRNRRSYLNYQHPSFHGRVKLRTPDMKGGDVSVVLNNVTFEDNGMYECHIAVRNRGRSGRVHSEISHFISLTVTSEAHENTLEWQLMEKEDAGGNPPSDKEVATLTVLAVVASVVAAVFTAVIFMVVFMMLWRYKQNKHVMLSDEVDNKQQPSGNMENGKQLHYEI